MNGDTVSDSVSVGGEPCNPTNQPDLDALEAHLEKLEADRDSSTEEAENLTAGMREVALFRAANAQGCIGNLARPLLRIANEAVAAVEAARAENEQLRAELSEANDNVAFLSCETNDRRAELEAERGRTAKLTHALESVAPRTLLWGGCGTPYCGGWMASLTFDDYGNLGWEIGCPCHSEDGWEPFDEDKFAALGRGGNVDE